jgi:hypothetical protein
MFHCHKTAALNKLDASSLKNAQHAAGEPRPTDEAGNPVLRDVGAHLKALFKGGALGDVDLKYIESGALVQATPSCASDHILSKTLGHHAVDAAFAGYSCVLFAFALVGGGQRGGALVWWGPLALFASSASLSHHPQRLCQKIQTQPARSSASWAGTIACCPRPS